jgi:hypothetical protein
MSTGFLLPTATAGQAASIGRIARLVRASHHVDFGLADDPRGLHPILEIIGGGEGFGLGAVGELE